MNLDEIRVNAIVEWGKIEHPDKPLIIVGAATCGQAAGANSVLKSIYSALEDNKVDAAVMQVGCIGICYAEPLVDIVKPGQPRICYANMTAEKAAGLIRDYLVNGNPRTDLALGTLGDGKVEGIPRFFDLPMLKPQVRIILRNCGFIDPENIKHYIARDGYKGIQRALTMSPDNVITEIKDSGLRGRGGVVCRVALVLG